MHAMHARRASLESQSLLLHLEDACSFPNGVRQRNGQAAWVFSRFYPYFLVIVRMAAMAITTLHGLPRPGNTYLVVTILAVVMVWSGKHGVEAVHILLTNTL